MIVKITVRGKIPYKIICLMLPLRFCPRTFVSNRLATHEKLVCTMVHTNFAGAVVLYLGPQRHLWVYNNLIGPQRKGLHHWNNQT